MPDIITVNGTIDAADLGITHSHEHILWDYWDLLPSYNHIHDDVALACAELDLFKASGGGAMVDASTVGIRVDPLRIRQISARTGVHLVAGAGWYRERLYPQVVRDRTSEHLADVLVEEIEQGMDGTDVRAGVIGEIGTERYRITPAEERVFRAAAIASQRTGVAILTHTTHFGELAVEQIELLTGTGVAPDRIIVSHLGDRRDVDHLLRIAETGVYLSIDNIGYERDGYPADEVRLQNIAALVERGHRAQIVLGTDISTVDALHAGGGRGYSWLIDSFVPRMRSAGLDAAVVDDLLVHNIARALSVTR
ncbi:hypothetical protein EFK50_12190 [Nocardioides marmoriginsengisoli]|uniref:Phosphotriesterase-related protein n=1 Tax=Nocardioides marmoriginsengisoli TaxID=661483 RepID=A0A3N0CGC4_9ACTN|nr:hypothetical protein [Nocardioides marmoriginsengisoli]RNL62522.1 hypothetical protein EFK50_12190 [Nocardioides marmoriginsengisoli]